MVFASVVLASGYQELILTDSGRNRKFQSLMDRLEEFLWFYESFAHKVATVHAQSPCAPWNGIYFASSLSLFIAWDSSRRILNGFLYSLPFPESMVNNLTLEKQSSCSRQIHFLTGRQSQSPYILQCLQGTHKVYKTTYIFLQFSDQELG